jgi:hypothetical protein
MYLNITWNYGGLFREHLGTEGIHTIIGMTGAEATPLLEKAIAGLDGEPDDDYWASTPGNARKALERLLRFAKERPDGVFRGW